MQTRSLAQQGSIIHATGQVITAQLAAAAGRGYVHAQALPLVVGEAAGVSGFAFQGTNAHVIPGPIGNTCTSTYVVEAR